MSFSLKRQLRKLDTLAGRAAREWCVWRRDGGRGVRWLVFGDSHVSVFQHAEARGWIAARCRFRSVGGATAVGLRNPNSLTNAFESFQAALLPPRRRVIPVIHLGEVDCGFVIWWRAERHGEPVEQQIDASIDAYLAFVDQLLLAGYPAVVITGATMPTILDGQDWGEVANARREVRASQAERIALTRAYNARLRAGAEARGLPFIDIAEAIIDPASGAVAARFRHPDRANHHLNPETAGPLWAAGLNAIAICAEWLV